MKHLDLLLLLVALFTLVGFCNSANQDSGNKVQQTPILCRYCGREIFCDCQKQASRQNKYYEGKSNHKLTEGFLPNCQPSQTKTEK